MSLLSASRSRVVSSFIALMAFLVVGGPATAQAPLKPVKSANFRPFSIVSTKLQKEMPDHLILDRLMCRSTLTTMAEFMDLVQNYDLLRTNPMDGTMSMTTFRGRQDGQSVEVMLAVQTSDRTLHHIWVAGKPVFSCI